jgi:hypothetical protein
MILNPFNPSGNSEARYYPTFDVNPNYNYSSQFYNLYVGLSESNKLHEERKRKIAGNNDGSRIQVDHALTSS